MRRLDAQPVLHRLAERGQGTRAGALPRRVAPVAQRADEHLCALARVGCGQLREAPQGDLAVSVGALPAPVRH